MKFILKDEYVEKIGQNPVLLSFLALRTELPTSEIRSHALARDQLYLTCLDLLHALQAFYGLPSIYQLLDTPMD